MKKTLTLICFYLGLWGVLGFLATIAMGFLICCMGWSRNLYYILLVLVALFGIVMTCRSVYKCCSKKPDQL